MVEEVEIGIKVGPFWTVIGRLKSGCLTSKFTTKFKCQISINISYNYFIFNLLTA